MSLTIQFSNSKYTVGDVISGTIAIKNDAPMEVTGLKITMFIQCRIVTMVNSEGKFRTSSRIHPLKKINLNSIILEGTKKKLLPPGFRVIPFSFTLSTEYPSTFEGDKIFCRYLVRVDLSVLPIKVISTTRDFRVNVLSLNDNSAALGWQTKSDSKFLKFPTKNVSMKVTIPTGIDRRETVPIFISMQNDSRHRAIRIRSKLICTLRLPRDINKKDIEIIANKNQKNINVSNGNFMHFLKIHSEFSFKSPLVSEKFRVEVEVEFSNGIFLKVEFPVIVGVWKDRPCRLEGPFCLPIAPPSYEEAMQSNSAPPYTSI